MNAPAPEAVTSRSLDFIPIGAAGNIVPQYLLFVRDATPFEGASIRRRQSLR
jgi:hypothetical protein